MQPTHPKDIERILSSRPNVDRDNIREYDHLLARRMSINPNEILNEAETEKLKKMNERIRELHRFLFG